MRIAKYNNFIKERYKILPSRYNNDWAEIPGGLTELKEILSEYTLDDVIKKVANSFGYSKSKIEYLGAGSYGVAFEVVGLNKVIKLTTDGSEAKNAEKLSKINTKHLVNYYDVRNIEFTDLQHLSSRRINIEKVYAIVLDKVNPVNSDYHEYISVLTSKIYSETNLSNLFSNQTIEMIATEDDLDIDTLKYIATDINHIVKEMVKVFKIKSVSQLDLHEENIGLDNEGHLVYFDITDLTLFDMNGFKGKRKPINLNESKSNEKRSVSKMYQDMLDDGIESLVTSIYEEDLFLGDCKLEFVYIGTFLTNTPQKQEIISKPISNGVLPSYEDFNIYNSPACYLETVDGGLSLYIHGHIKRDKLNILTSELETFAKYNNYTIKKYINGNIISDAGVNYYLTKNYK